MLGRGAKSRAQVGSEQTEKQHERGAGSERDSKRIGTQQRVNCCGAVDDNKKALHSPEKPGRVVCGNNRVEPEQRSVARKTGELDRVTQRDKHEQHDGDGIALRAGRGFL